MKILIIDDEPAIREILRSWLEGHDMTVFEADNGHEGVLFHQATPVDLVICDLIMPVQEGIETIAYFRNHFPEVGIFAISGGGSTDPDTYLEIARHLGAFKIFRKPLDMPAMLTAIQDWRQHRLAAKSAL